MNKSYLTLFILVVSTVYSFGQCSPDVTNPVITCPGNITVACPHLIGNIFAFQSSLTPTTSDNCGSIVLQTYTFTGATTFSSPNTGINDASNEIFLAGTTTVTYYIEDASGNNSNCSFTVTVNDFTVPTVTCPSDLSIGNTAGSCFAQVTQNELGFPTAFDNCNGLSLAPTGITLIDQPDPLPDYYEFPVGTTTVTWTVTDLAGNSDTCIQDVTVIDVEPPTITCPPDMTVSTAPGQCSTNVTIPLAVAADNCTITSIINDQNAGGADASGVYPLGITTVTFTATASDGLTTSCSFEVTVTNAQAPVISLVGADPITMGACGTYIEFGATAIDICLGDISGDIVINADDVINNITNPGTYQVTYNVTNAAGVPAVEVTRTIIIIDTVIPVLSFIGPNPLTIGDCSTYTELGALALDCTGDLSGDVVATSNVDTSTLGTYTVTYNVSDGSGNAAIPITRTVHVIDVNEPVITLVGDNPQIIEACSPYVELGATALDLCPNIDYTSDIVIDATAVNTNVVGNYTVTYNVEDIYNNIALEVIRDVQVVDTTGPTITCPGNIAIDNDLGLCTAVVNYTTPVGSDACLSATTVQTAGLPSGSVFPLGTTTNTFEVTDDEGLIATCSFDVIVNDTENPTISCPSDITTSNDSGQCSAVVNYATPVGTDNCGGTITTLQIAGLASGSSFPIGSTTNTFQVTDNVGNTSTCSFDVIINDTQAPTITCPSNMNVVNAIGFCYAQVNYATPVGADNCSGQVTIQTAGLPSGSNFPIGLTINTFQVTDTAGNTATCSFNITVTDSEFPAITCPTDITMNNDLGLCSAVVNYTTPTGTDNCAGQNTIQTAGLPSGSIFPIGTTTNTFEVTDAANNVTVCSFDVTVNDTELPIALCQDISVQLDPSTGLASILPTDIDNGSSDNCAYTLSLSITSFDCNDIGNNSVTLTITDDSGNSSSCTANVLVTDLSENASVTITASDTQICINESVTFTATPTNGGASPGYQWQVNGIDAPGENASTFTSTTLTGGDQVTVLMTSSQSVCAQELTSNSITMTINSFDLADAGTDYINTVCTSTTYTLSGNIITAAGSSGLWTVTSGQISGFSFSDDTSPTSTFTGDIGETYTLEWSIDNPSTCPDSSDSMTITFIGCNALDFDGVDDNVTFRNNYNFTGDFSIEVWIKSEISNGNTQTIISKRESNNQINGYDLRLENDIISFNWNNGQSITASPIQINLDQWHHIAVTFSSGTYKLYIDGIEVSSGSGVVPISNTVDYIVGAMDQTLTSPFKPLHYFDGGMDELRIWDKALTVDQIRTMMNQEIESNSGNIKGSIVPIEIADLNWGDLTAYYQMNQNVDIVGGTLTSNNASIDGLLRYMTTFQPETAPIPYQSDNNGDWTNSNTWLHGNSQAIPNSIGVDGTTSIDWNIVRTVHNISSTDKNITLLGLNVNSNTLSIENTDPLDGHSLRITDYLIITDASAVLDLEGESQLLQDPNSIVDYTGNGNLHRDQQGTNNLYNYNYWGSPVSSEGASFNIGSILYDGTQPVLWTTANDANSATNPITMSSRWLYLYENFPENSYASWHSIDENFNIDVGLGFLMKGSGTASATQNYTFKGKPNNGTVNSPITASYEALVGNPYPSAIDAHEFIIDNVSSTIGTLYFWEHYGTNATHVTADYQGGYAAYNLTGGNAAVSPPEISGLGIPSKIPERFIPVSQGFTVLANATGGTIKFENDQRVFVKEAVTGAADNGSVFMRVRNDGSDFVINPEAENALIKRLRLDFVSPDGALRPLLLGFIPNGLATDDFDFGYDAMNTESLPNDLAWSINEEPYIIQGVGDFDTSKVYPLDLNLTISGNVEIALNSLENFEADINVYVYDTLLEVYYHLNEQNFITSLEATNYNNRFYITFNDEEFS
ncbi:MAG: HYR domain-containing protein, partial [Proteobacteria bacterium]|nr:HYR domain-containing protein [Pseudomonadota bacterium]